MHHHIVLLKCLELYHPPKRDSTLGTPSLALALKKSLMHAFTSLISITLDTPLFTKRSPMQRRCCYKKSKRPFCSQNRAGESLVGDPPALEPLEVFPLAARSNHTEGDGPEQPVQEDGSKVQYSKDAPLYLLVQLPCGEVQAEAHNDDGKPQSGVVVVHICDTAHGDEWCVVESPANDGIDTCVVEQVDFRLLQVIESTLPADDVKEEKKTENA
jgi:hypothetical protein